MSIARVSISLLYLAYCVFGHGRLLDPPSRSSAWRAGFNTPKNYDDNGLFCGGMGRQQSNGGRCGVCGDPWDALVPRDNEAGGKYATGVIVRNYTAGQVIRVRVEITANHMGWFEFRLCPNNDVTRTVTHECLDRHLLSFADESGTRYQVRTGRTGYYNMLVKLPEGLTCTQCVFQWKYHAGNSWGVDPVTGRGCVGCGAQEEFYGCSDIAIQPSVNVHPPATTTSTAKSTITTAAQSPAHARCTGKGIFSTPQWDNFCRKQCDRGHCAINMCNCD